MLYSRVYRGNASRYNVRRSVLRNVFDSDDRNCGKIHKIGQKSGGEKRALRRGVSSDAIVFGWLRSDFKRYSGNSGRR